jgi:predicted DCC family thiol-disulfide oxidoreductase YuxK
MPITVYIDGECPLCVAGALRLRKLDRRNSIAFRNARDPEEAAHLPPRLSGETALRSMAAQMPDGTWRVGYFAWAAILSRIAITRPLGLAMSLPFFYGIGPAAYRWVADHRFILSRIFRLPPPCDENGTCRIDLAQANRKTAPALFGGSA